MTRATKIFALSALTAGLVAAAASPALANRHSTSVPETDDPRATLVSAENRHGTMEPLENRHQM
ncbi:hypothetical protein [Streptomyces sp. JJ36]|uniref:hypothetical protein n=1 Tax=Streptomyces sp. JJ36 TaxID=2736645 RepID=UPI001F1918C2|nr:hypothetical protein [Streptomyces sp. JJ36]MCF6525888.1 hypothetical protein [Streptomyces sp. JJ36]